jgi:hypothetical protein
MEQKKVKIPAFTPTKYEVKSKVYDDSGGSCMVGTLKVYLPEIVKIVWVNCSSDGVYVDAGDTVWDSENDGSIENAYDLNIYAVDFDDEIPASIDQWLPIIKETVAYTAEQEIAYLGSISLPVKWLPDAIREKADQKHLDSMEEKGEWVEFDKDGVIIEEEDDYATEGDD